MSTAKACRQGVEWQDVICVVSLVGLRRSGSDNLDWQMAQSAKLRKPMYGSLSNSAAGKKEIGVNR